MSPSTEFALLMALFPKDQQRLRELVLQEGIEKGIELFCANLLEVKPKPPKAPPKRRSHLAESAIKLMKGILGRPLTKSEERQVTGFFELHKDNEPEQLWEHWKVRCMRPDALQGDWPVNDFVKVMAGVARSQKQSRVTNYVGSLSRYVEWKE